MRRWKAAVALVLGVAVLAGISTANAARLEVQAELTLVEDAACTTRTLSTERIDFRVSPWGYHGVRISGIPEECRGLPIHLSADSGVVSGTLPNGATSASASIPTGPYLAIFGPRDFSAVFDGWHVPLGRAD